MTTCTNQQEAETAIGFSGIRIDHSTSSMISRLLVAVLLFCAVAITTPNSTEAATEKQLVASQSQSESSASSSLSSKTHDHNHIDAPRRTVALQDADGPNPSGDRGRDIVASETNPVSRRRRHQHHQGAATPAESAFNDHQLAAIFSDSHHKQTSQPESTYSGTISAAAVATAGASNQSNLKQQDSERTTSFTNVDVEQQQQNTGSASSKSGSENVDSQTRQQQQQQASTPQAAAPAAATESKNNGKNSQQQEKQLRKIFTNQFVIEIKGGKEEARRLAVKHGFIYLDHIIDDYYHLEHRRLAKRSIDSKDLGELDISIEEEPHVLKLERQVLKTRVQRDFMDLGAGPPPPPPSNTPSLGLGRVHAANNQQQQERPMFRPSATGGRPAQFLRPANQPPATPPTPNGQYADTRRFGSASASAVGRWHQQQPGPGNSRLMSAPLPPAGLFDQLEMTSSGPPPFFLHANYSSSSATQPLGAINKHRPPPPPLLAGGGGGNQTAAFHYANDSVRATPTAPFNDPSWPHMWYLDGGARNGFDLNVQAAWQMGYTGKGIVITILDDGLEKDHPDLQANYDPLASFDINGDDADPMPRYDANDSNRHGTRCAGEVAAVRDNNICSIGIAYNSRVGGVRMLDGDVTDAVEARSLGLNNQHIHIYSASWGPDDNGKTVDGPGELATRAFIEGVTNGRQGLGSIFVFASGNGGREHDNCNCDGYTNSIWTLSISSATQNGYVPWYIENCSSTLAATYSSGSLEEKQIATTDIRHSCTNNHTGTSASAPIAAGICALVLESNPRLTWRDMQHIVVRTAKPANLIAKDWRTNALGRNVSHAFGYGLMDAAAMIHVAKRWTTVPLQYTCEVRSPQMERPIPAKGYIELKLRAECANVRYLEHVQSKITLSASRRGDLHIYLTSPHGTRSTLLAQRPYDQADQGFRNWPFMTVHSWGESPNGVWTLEVHNDGKSQTRASLKEWTLVLYGTSDDPNKHLSMNSGMGNQATLVGANSAHSTTPQPPPPPVLRLQPQVSSPPAPSFPPTVAVEPRKQQQPNSFGAPPPPMRPDEQTTTTTTTTTTTSSPVIKTTTPVRTGGGGGGGPPTSTSEPQWEENNKNTTTISGGGDYRQYGAGSRPQTPQVDFEIVSPPSGSTVGSANESSMSPADHHDEDRAQPQRPHILLPIDNNKIDGQITPAGAPASTTTSRPPVVGQQQNELDANQLDSRLTKDYRSSGGRGHDVVSTTTTTTLGSESNQDLKLNPGDAINGDVDSVLEQQQPEAKQRHKNVGNNSTLALYVGCNSWLIYLVLFSLAITYQQTRVAALVH